MLLCCRDFVFWHLPQLQYKNPNVQVMTLTNMTPSPFITCFFGKYCMCYVTTEVCCNNFPYNYIEYRTFCSICVVTVSNLLFNCRHNDQEVWSSRSVLVFAIRRYPFLKLSRISASLTLFTIFLSPLYEC